MINSQYRKPLPGTTLDYFDTEEAIEALAPGSYRKLPYTSKVLAENLVRRCDPSLLDAALMQLIERKRDLDFPWYPARVVCHDILGQTALVDLAGLRDAIAARGGDPAQVNPVVPTQLIVDHSLAVEHAGFDPDAFEKNRAIEDRRNDDRFHFIDWTKTAFENVDVMLHWHPGSLNSASPRSTNSNMSGKFTFKGISAHAASAPHKGRSALDGVEAMNMMVNMMREHVPQDSRLHYVITKGGLAPNVVPDLAQVYYYVRHPRREVVKELFARVVNTANGAALGTGTTMSYEVMHGNYSLLPNETLQRVMQEKLEELGGVTYSDDEQKYAETIYKTLVQPSGKIGDQETINPYQRTHGYGSTDVGDVSWLIPTGGIGVATWVPGTAAHSWQAVAAGGMSIGLKGTKLAVKALAATALEIYENPSIVAQAKQELQDNVGPDFDYEALLGDRKPPLDYRNN